MRAGDVSIAQPEINTRKRRLPHARGIRAAFRMLDAVAGATGQLAPRRQAGAGGIRRRGDRDRGQRAGDRRRVGGAVSKRARALAAQCARGRDRAATMRGCATAGRPSSSMRRARRRGIDWTFNAWGGLHGGLYFPWDRDDQVAQKVLEMEGADRYRTPLVMEGGAIHVDGQGTCLTTEECLLNPNRNPHLTRDRNRGAAAPLPGGEQGDMAGQGRLSGRDRRPHR